MAALSSVNRNEQTSYEQLDLPPLSPRRSKSDERRNKENIQSIISFQIFLYIQQCKSYGLLQEQQPEPLFPNDSTLFRTSKKDRIAKIVTGQNTSSYSIAAYHAKLQSFKILQSLSHPFLPSILDLFSCPPNEEIQQKWSVIAIVKEADPATYTYLADRVNESIIPEFEDLTLLPKQLETIPVKVHLLLPEGVSFNAYYISFFTEESKGHGKPLYAQQCKSFDPEIPLQIPFSERYFVSFFVEGKDQMGVPVWCMNASANEIFDLTINFSKHRAITIDITPPEGVSLNDLAIHFSSNGEQLYFPQCMYFDAQFQHLIPHLPKKRAHRVQIFKKDENNEYRVRLFNQKIFIANQGKLAINLSKAT